MGMRSAVAAIVLLGGIAAATAQPYPTQPIRIFHNYAPGGGVDVTLRELAQKLTDTGWPQVIVENPRARPERLPASRPSRQSRTATRSCSPI